MARLILYLTMFVIIIGLPGAIVSIWTVQNLHQTARLGLDLAALGAWEMATPMSVPALMGASFGTGVLVGMVLVGLWTLVRRVKRRRAEPVVESDAFTSVA